MTDPLDPCALGCGHANARHDDNSRCQYPGCLCGLRDAKASADARDEGMDLAGSSAEVTEAWKNFAMLAIRMVAAKQPELASIDVVEFLIEAGKPPPPKSRVMGPLMRRAAALGYIEGPIRTQASDRVTHHKGLENVWASKLYRSPSTFQPTHERTP